MGVTGKMCEKHLWKSDILSKDVVLKMSFFRRRFSHILLVKTIFKIFKIYRFFHKWNIDWKWVDIRTEIW